MPEAPAATSRSRQPLKQWVQRVPETVGLAPHARRQCTWATACNASSSVLTALRMQPAVVSTFVASQAGRLPSPTIWAEVKRQRPMSTRHLDGAVLVQKVRRRAQAVIAPRVPARLRFQQRLHHAPAIAMSTSESTLYSTASWNRAGRLSHDGCRTLRVYHSVCLLSQP